MGRFPGVYRGCSYSTTRSEGECTHASISVRSAAASMFDRGRRRSAAGGLGHPRPGDRRAKGRSPGCCRSSSHTRRAAPSVRRRPPKTARTWFRVSCPALTKVSAQLTGFSRLTQEDLVVRIGSTLQVDLALESARSKRTSRSRPNRRRSTSRRRRSAATSSAATSTNLPSGSRNFTGDGGAAARRGLQRGGRLIVRQRHHQRPARRAASCT